MTAPNEEIEGQYAGVTISQASVPGAASGDRINNEGWTLFGNGDPAYWIEDGIFVGHEYGTFDKTGKTSSTEPLWFYAVNLDDGSEKGGYLERDYTYGPSVGSGWWFYHLAEGNNTWCVYFENSQAACYDPSGFETYTKWMQEGLEDYYNETAPVNNGTMIGEGEWNNGTWHNWEGSSGNQTKYFASPGFCAEMPGGGGYGLGALVYSTGSCGGDALVEGLATMASPAKAQSVTMTEGHLPGVIPGATANPAPRYNPPTGTTMNASELTAIAKRVAAEAGDESPSQVVGVRTNLGLMSGSLAPQLQTSTGSSVATYEASEVEWVELHGSFALPEAQVPHGQGTPTGSVLDVGIDTHTGHVDLIALTHTTKTAQMEALGSVAIQ
jgi:hypothetical protein